MSTSFRLEAGVSALILLAWHQKEHPVYKNLSGYVLAWLPVLIKT